MVEMAGGDGGGGGEDGWWWWLVVRGDSGGGGDGGGVSITSILSSCLPVLSHFVLHACVSSLQLNSDNCLAVPT